MAVVYSIGKSGSTIENRYVGVSKDSNRRKKEHFKLLNEGLHSNETLQKAFDDSFDFRIELHGELDYCYEIESLLRPKWYQGLNESPGGRGGVGNVPYERNSWAKHNRNGLLGNEFTSETAREFALERSKERKLPAQVAKDTREFGNLVFFTKENKQKTAERNSKLFSKTTSVTDKNGNTKRISVKEFKNQQIGKREDWQYVGAASKEAKMRRGEI